MSSFSKYMNFIGIVKDDIVNFLQAKQSFNSQKWIDAINDEIKSMNYNDVQNLVDYLKV